jgi:Trypsin-like peptidase domain/Effector-associated domain 1
MATILETPSFPWELPHAQELHAALCEIYPTSKGAVFIAQRAGLDPARLFADQAAFLIWKEVLEEGARQGKNRLVVTVARDQNPTNPRRPLLDALLSSASVAVVLDHQPRGIDGAPVFISGDDQVTEPEALLFHDDLTLAIGRIPWLISVLQRLQSIAPAVCRMRVSFAAGTQNGTAFRIAQNLLLTNWHVLHYQGVRGGTAAAEFGYEDDGQGGGLASTAVACNLATVRGDAVDDWAIVETTVNLPATAPIVKLSEAVEPTSQALAFIVQHPGGERKRIAYVRNQVTAFTDHVVHYLSDTQTGSSGSPVFHESGRLMALHRAGGRPQEVAGRTPLRKNEGIRIPHILNGLAKLGVAVP